MEKKTIKLEDIKKQIQDDIEKKRKEYELKQQEIMQKLEEKRIRELEDCMRTKAEIERKLSEKQLKHDLIIMDQIGEVQAKNQLWRERKDKFLYESVQQD